MRAQSPSASSPTERLGPGDCVAHSGAIAHRWVVVGDATVRLFLVMVTCP